VIVAGTAAMTWVKVSIAYAEGHDEVEQRYRGLRTMELIPVTSDDIQDCRQYPEIAL